MCILPNDGVFGNDEATAAEAAALLRGKGAGPSPTVEAKSKLALIYLTYPTAAARPSPHSRSPSVGSTDLG